MKSKIKILAIIISVLTVMAWMLPMIAVSAEDTLVISSSSAEGERGETVEVTLTVDSNPGFAAMVITVSKSSDIEVVEVKNGTVMKSMTAGNNILWDSASNSTKTGTLVTITFLIKDSAKFGEHVITVRMNECFNETFDAVPVTIEPIVINVLGEDTEEESTTAESESESQTEPDESNTEDVSENNPVDDTTEKEEDGETTSEKKEPLDEDTENKPSSNKGCGLSVSGFAAVIAIIPTAIIIAKKRR